MLEQPHALQPFMRHRAEIADKCERERERDAHTAPFTHLSQTDDTSKL
jgi:hypothetical protein